MSKQLNQAHGCKVQKKEQKKKTTNEINELKQAVVGFEDRYKAEIKLIQEHYRLNAKQYKAKKKNQLR